MKDRTIEEILSMYSGRYPFSVPVCSVDSYPRISQDVKRESVERVSCGIGALDGLDSIVTATGSGSDLGVIGDDVERPSSLIVKV